MIGGDFMVNMGGLEHYKKFGYKGICTKLMLISKNPYIIFYVFIK